VTYLGEGAIALGGIFLGVTSDFYTAHEMGCVKNIKNKNVTNKLEGARKDNDNVKSVIRPTAGYWKVSSDALSK
jgi:hypothetical protein